MKSGNGRGSGQSPQDGMSRLMDGPKSVDEMLALGERAARALNEEGVNDAYLLGVRSIVLEWMTSEPHEKLKRDALYSDLRGLERAFKSLGSAAQSAQEHLRQEAEKRRINETAMAAGEPREY